MSVALAGADGNAPELDLVCVEYFERFKKIEADDKAAFKPRDDLIVVSLAISLIVVCKGVSHGYRTWSTLNNHHADNCYRI